MATQTLDKAQVERHALVIKKNAEEINKLRAKKDYGGRFDTEALRDAAYPTPEKGDWVTVGATPPYILYVHDGSTWNKVGADITDKADIDLLNTTMEDSALDTLEKTRATLGKFSNPVKTISAIGPQLGNIVNADGSTTSKTVAMQSYVDNSIAKVIAQIGSWTFLGSVDDDPFPILNPTTSQPWVDKDIALMKVSGNQPVVSGMPANPKKGYDIFVFDGPTKAWVYVGHVDTLVDLTNYYTKQEVDGKFNQTITLTFDDNSTEDIKVGL